MEKPGLKSQIDQKKRHAVLISKHWKNTDGIKPESEQANIQKEDAADIQYIRSHSMDKTFFVLCFSLT